VVDVVDDVSAALLVETVAKIPGLLMGVKVDCEKAAVGVVGNAEVSLEVVVSVEVVNVVNEDVPGIAVAVEIVLLRLEDEDWAGLLLFKGQTT
jgi:hypothetical protein